MKMPKLINRVAVLAIALGLVASGAAAQNDYKVLEASAKKAPVWFEKAETDYIITSSIASTIDAARDQCLDNVRKRLIESVAQNVQFSTTSNVAQTTGSGGANDFRDDFASSLTTQAAKIPFIKGISVSKIEDSYWQKRQNKQTKAITFIYAIKYPFPSLELKKLVRAFEEQDAEMVAKLRALENGLDSVASVEQIERAISACTPLEEYFFDDVRKAKAKTLQSEYRKLYDQIVISSNDVKLGETQLMFQLAGRPITVSQVPAIKSENATQLRYTVAGDKGLLKYAWENCLDEETSEILLTYRFGSRIMTYKVYFCPDSFKATITPVGTVLLSKLPEGFTLDMELTTAGTPSVTINEMTLEIPEIEGVMVLDNLGKTVTGDATHRFSVSTVSEVPWKVANLTNVMRGTLRGTYGNEKTPFTRAFTLIYKMKVNP